MTLEYENPDGNNNGEGQEPEPAAFWQIARVCFDHEATPAADLSSSCLQILAKHPAAAGEIPTV